MRLIKRLREDQRGSALITAILATALMLALGTALLSIVDTEASQSAGERTRDRAFNLAESVLNSEAFVLGRNWPATTPTPNPVTCSVSGAGFGDTLGSTSPTPTAATARLKPNLDASYTDSAYSGATWQVNICDNTTGSNVWSSSLLGNPSWDSNGDNKVWVHAQATVGGLTRVVVGLVQTRTNNPLNAKFGLVSGAMSDDLSATTAAITNASVLSGLKNGLLNTYPPVAADTAFPSPASGVTGVRCGLLSQATQLKTCVSGALGALSSLPVFDALVTGGAYAQFPSLSATTPDAIGQLRTQSKSATGVYMATAPGATPTSSTDDSNIPSCGITGATPNSVVFIEKVGNGDQYCAIDVGSAGVTYKALVIGSGRVVIRGNNTITTYTGVANPVNQFTGVVYALNLQTSDQTVSTPTKELVRIEKGARVKGAVYADGKNATVGLVAPDFDVNALVTGLLCGGASSCLVGTTLTGLLSTLGVSGIVNDLINGQCLVTLPILGCTVSVPGLGATAVLTGITAQLTSYGSAIHSDVATVNKLTVYGASGVVGGTFDELLSH